MNPVEKTCIAVRHGPAVTGSNGSWNAVRLIYDLALDVSSWRGLDHTINGTDPLLADAFRAPRLICLEVHAYNWYFCDTTSDSLLGRLAFSELSSSDAQRRTLPRGASAANP